MSKFIDLVGDNDGPLVYSYVNDSGVDGFHKLVRTSEDLTTGDQDVIKKRFPTILKGRTVVYNNKVKLQRAKEAVAARVAEFDREINAIDLLLNGWEPPVDP